MYANLLVPLDGTPLSEKILPDAQLLARSFGATLELLHVIETTDVPESGARDIERDARLYLERIAASLTDTPVTQCHILPGNPAEVIVDTAAADRQTLIAMATHGYSLLQRLLVGSVATKVVQVATNPVLLVPVRGETTATEPPGFENIIAPLDGSPLAEKVLPEVSALSRRLETNVILLRAYDPQFPGTTIRMHEVAEIVHDAAQVYLEDKVRQLRDDGLENVSCEVLRGRPAAEIAEYARATPRSLIVIGSHGHSGIGRWLVGSVTHAVMHLSDRPVLIIRVS
jgi:nucleotide-binding universal stress UspA family protein